MRPGRPDPRDRGSIAPAVPILALVLLLLAGLVIDASRQLTERSRAVAYAEEAARAGASAIDLDSSDLTLLPESTVADRVNGYCRDAVAAGAAITSPQQCFQGIGEVGHGDHRRLVVRAHVDVVERASLLGLVGVRELRASGDGKARPFEGTDEEDAQ